jgi:membrane fusion protein, heavy metal efflux system
MNTMRASLVGAMRRCPRCASHRPRHISLLTAVLFTGTLAAVLAGCGSGEKSAAVMTSFSAGENATAEPELFTVPPEQMGHLTIETMAPERMKRVLRLTGTVAYNAFQTTPVISQAGGLVSRIVVAPGDHVRAGQPVLYVSSADYSLQRASYLKARDAWQLADRNYERAKDLYAHKAIAERDLQQADSERSQAQADLDASTAALRVMGVSNPESLAGQAFSEEVPVLAPIDGAIVERLISPGQVIQAGATQCFTISDMSTVWVLADVYQKDLASVHVGGDVTVQNDSYPDVFRGKISYIGSALDPATRTVQARIVTSNPGEKLKKDMYVTAIVQAGEIVGALSIPDAGVLRDSENMPFVYVQNDSNKFARRQVTVGESQDGRTQITSGLKPGDHVVADGSLFLQFQNSLR